MVVLPPAETVPMYTPSCTASKSRAKVFARVSRLATGRHRSLLSSHWRRLYGWSGAGCQESEGSRGSRRSTRVLGQVVRTRLGPEGPEMSAVGTVGPILHAQRFRGPFRSAIRARRHLPGRHHHTMRPAMHTGSLVCTLFLPIARQIRRDRLRFSRFRLTFVCWLRSCLTVYNSLFMASDRTIDDMDAVILTMLQENARVSQAEIARAVGLVPSAVLERIRKLEARRVIKGYAAQIDPDAVDRSMLAFVSVRTADRPGETRVAQAVAAVPDVLEVHHVAGDDCLVLKIRASNPSHLSRILRDRLGPIDGIRSTRTTIVLETVKEESRLPIDIPQPADGIAS